MSTGRSWSCLVRISGAMIGAPLLARKRQGGQAGLCWCDLLMTCAMPSRLQEEQRRWRAPQPRTQTARPLGPQGLQQVGWGGRRTGQQLAAHLAGSPVQAPADRPFLFLCCMQASGWQGPPTMCTCLTSAPAPGPRSPRWASPHHHVPRMQLQLSGPWWLCRCVHGLQTARTWSCVVCVAAQKPEAAAGAKVVPWLNPTCSQRAASPMCWLQGGIGPAGLASEDLHVLDFTDMDRPRWHRCGAGNKPHTAPQGCWGHLAGSGVACICTAASTGSLHSMG